MKKGKNAHFHPTRKLKEPKELIALWEEFKEWNQKQVRPVPAINPKTGEQFYFAHIPPLTITAFQVWTVNEKCWGIGSIDNYLDNEFNNYDDFKDVVAHMKREAKNDRFNGAACGQFKEGLISRFDGYKDSSEVEVKTEPRIFNID